MSKKAAKGSINKSQAIRDALKAHPGKKPKDLAAVLNEQGVKVTAQYVSVIKGSAKGKRKSVKVRKPRKGTALGSLGSAMEFIRAAGSLAAAKQALAEIEQIRDLA